MNILVVVDMQNDFLVGPLGSTSSRAIVSNVINRIMCHKGPIIATLDTHDDYYPYTIEGQNLPIPHCMKGTRGQEIHPSVKRAILMEPNNTFIEKGTFGSVQLIGHLKKYYDTQEMHTIEMVGLLTDMCVVSNALLIKANFPDWNIIIHSSCCAGSTPSNHKAALDVMKSCHMEVV